MTATTTADRVNNKPRNRKKVEPKAADMQSDTREEMLKLYSGISLSFHWWGMMRSVDRGNNSKAAEAMGAKPEATYTQTRLIDTSLEEWKDINGLKNAIAGWFQNMTLPYVIKGMRLFRVEMRDDILSHFVTYQGLLAKQAARLTAARPKIIVWAKENLGKELFNEAYYPKDFGHIFSLTVREHSIDPPAYLRTRDDETWRAAMNRALNDMRQGMARFETDCLAKLGRDVGTLTTALTDGNGIREATLKNMQATFARITQMRFDGTAMFKSCMARAEELVDGIELADLRRSHAAKQDTLTKLKELMTEYTALREAAVKRAETTTDEQA